MAKTYLFLTFPEFQKGFVSEKSYFLEVYDTPKKKELDDLLLQLYDFWDFFKDEECVMFYDKHNFDTFRKYISDNNKIALAKLDINYKAVNRILKCWEKKICIPNETAIVAEEKQIYDIRGAIAYDLLENKEKICRENPNKSDEEKAMRENRYLYINLSYTSKTPNSLNISVNKETISFDVRKMKISDVFEWLCENRRPCRTYHWSDKHGENYGQDKIDKEKCKNETNKGSKIIAKRKKASHLLCSREHAKDLLKSAVGGYQEEDSSTNNAINRKEFRIFVWDEQFEHYMEYESEFHNNPDGKPKDEPIVGPDGSKTYHSFHLEMDEKKLKQRLGNRVIEKLSKISNSPLTPTNNQK